MQITAQLVNELRKKTNIGMMECKKALVACDGDMEAAIEHLRKAGPSTVTSEVFFLFASVWGWDDTSLSVIVSSRAGHGVY